MRLIVLKLKKAFSFQLLPFTLLLAFTGCKKSDNFYSQLKQLPQISYTIADAYKSAYVVGDTMMITGKLQPKNNLQINIGGVKANIVKVGTVLYNPDNDHLDSLDRVSILITQPMVGKSREVKVTSGGYSTLGSAIDVYTYGGPGSFTDSLKSVTIKTFTANNNQFLYNVNGKGDLYYFAPADLAIKHIKTDGTEDVVCNLSGDLLGNKSSLKSFLAGGVDQDGKTLWFSGSFGSSEYGFFQFDVTTGKLTLLNNSAAVKQPYEGDIGAVNMIVTGVFPNNKGIVYLNIGLGNNQISDPSTFCPDAIAKYDTGSGKVTYLYKNLVPENQFAGMPGIKLGSAQGQLSRVIGLRFAPQENLVYALESVSGTTNYIELTDLVSRVTLQSFTTADNTNSRISLDVVSTFQSLHTNLGGSFSIPDNSFGYMPMPGKRLQSLLFQYVSGTLIRQNEKNVAAQTGFPKWIVFDFNEQRTYAYATGRFNAGKDVFQPSFRLRPQLAARDELLNYDEAGNLYMTANGRINLIKTQTIN